MNLYAAVVENIPVKTEVVQTPSPFFASVFIYVEILSITIGVVLLFVAFYMLRPREEEQRRIQDQFLFYLILGLFLIFFPFVFEYLFS